ncbi:hypothetical protein GCM10009825_19980 [Arthrobacter humicola]|uniref:Uncharacterized protein n=1 Tax=Arthrobacter humicola TaxID=409291 RepID=A0ABN2Z298_9MICC
MSVLVTSHALVRLQEARLSQMDSRWSALQLLTASTTDRRSPARADHEVVFAANSWGPPVAPGDIGRIPFGQK